MKDIIKNIQISDKTILRGNLAQQYKAIVILSDTIKTEELPKNTRLPVMMRYKPSPKQDWNAEMQKDLCDFVITMSQQGKVLVCSDNGDSRAVACLVRVLIRLGFNKKNAMQIIKDRTGFEPKQEILDSLPETDNRNLLVIMRELFGSEKSVTATVSKLKELGFTKEELNKIK